MNIIYEIDRNDIWCSEEFVRIKINNSFGLTTEQVKNEPLMDRRNKPYSRIVGHLLEADKEYIYGIMYNPADLFDDRKEKFSMEIHYEDQIDWAELLWQGETMDGTLVKGQLLRMRDHYYICSNIPIEYEKCVSIGWCPPKVGIWCEVKPHTLKRCEQITAEDEDL